MGLGLVSQDTTNFPVSMVQFTGSVWVSNISYTNGYVGQMFTPQHWLHKVKDITIDLITLPTRLGK